MPSTDASASGRIARSASASPGPSSKKARISAWAAASRPTAAAREPGGVAGPSPEPDPELIDLPVEGRERQPEAVRGRAFVAVRAAEHGLDVHALVGAE